MRAQLLFFLPSHYHLPKGSNHKQGDITMVMPDTVLPPRPTQASPGYVYLLLPPRPSTLNAPAKPSDPAQAPRLRLVSEGEEAPAQCHAAGLPAGPRGSSWHSAGTSHRLHSSRSAELSQCQTPVPCLGRWSRLSLKQHRAYAWRIHRVLSHGSRVTFRVILHAECLLIFLKHFHSF